MPWSFFAHPPEIADEDLPPRDPEALRVIEPFQREAVPFGLWKPPGIAAPTVWVATRDWEESQLARDAIDRLEAIGGLPAPATQLLGDLAERLFEEHGRT